MNHTTGYGDDIARLAALTERCAAEDQTNLNKLLEAVIYAQTRRAGWHDRWFIPWL